MVMLVMVITGSHNVYLVLTMVMVVIVINICSAPIMWQTVF